ncbi:MAG: cation diffusion facilitator family transporter [Clostridiales bacterium]|nr:cation diffusion facilitator family transporter [Clostridiales bacterium]
MAASHGTEGRRVALWVLLANIFLTLGKGLAGYLFYSQALLADAVHSLGDAVASAGVLYGMEVARRPADRVHRYGHAKAEPLAGLAMGSFLIVAGGVVAVEALVTLWRGEVSATPEWPAFWVAAAALGLKEVLYRWNVAVARRLHSPALMANAADHRSDEWTSLAAMAGVVGAQLGWGWADPFFALVVGGVVAHYGFGVLLENGSDLLDRQADEARQAEIRAKALEVAGVKGIDSLRTRRSGPFVHVDMEIRVGRHLSLVEAHRLAHDVMEKVGSLDFVQDVVVHVNPEREEEA